MKTIIFILLCAVYCIFRFILLYKAKISENKHSFLMALSPMIFWLLYILGMVKTFLICSLGLIIIAIVYFFVIINDLNNFEFVKECYGVSFLSMTIELICFIIPSVISIFEISILGAQSTLHVNFLSIELISFTPLLYL